MNQLDREAAVFLHTYKRLPLEIERGEGCYLITRDGARYLDMFAGIAVNALGHAHPRVVRAIADQAARYVHVSNYFLQEPQIRLAEMITSRTPFHRIFFCNSGTEATEGAIKMARRWGQERGKSGVVALSNAFHGRSYGALSVMDRPSYRDGFGPFLDGCSSTPFNDVTALRNAVSPSTAAVLVEVIQGEGGIRPLSAEFVRELLSLQSTFGFLIIADEIQSGVWRTGTFFGFEHFGFTPDIVTMAKPLGGGLPLGAILAGPSVENVLQPGMHGTTFGGNPVACAAGIAVLSELDDAGVVGNVKAMGAFFKEGLQAIAASFPAFVSEVRGYGLMLGMELHREGDPVVAAMRDRGILINCTDKTVLRFVPALTVGRAEIETTLAALREVFTAMAGQ